MTGAMLGCERCRACQSTELELLVALGTQPPANAFVAEADLARPEAAYPLDAYACTSCGLVQLRNQLPPSFFDEYLYLPSGSQALPRHFREFAGRLADEELGDGGLLVDVGCNEGLLLAAARERGAKCLGIDPSRNIAEHARKRGIEVVNARFAREVARGICAEKGPARVVATTNTLNHVDDLDEFVEAVGLLLEPGGAFFIEVPRLTHFYAHTEVDTLYHEHLSVFSVRSLEVLLARHGFGIQSIEALDVHGGSMRVRATRAEPQRVLVEPWLEEEERLGIRTTEGHAAFRAKVGRLRIEFREFLEVIRANGKRCAGYGAPAKASTLLNYCGIGPDLIEYLADRNPLKQGRFSPGTHVPVVAPDRIELDSPDYLVVFAWNYLDEIVEQLAAYRERGGRFIVPIPKPRVLPVSEGPA